MDPSMVQFDQWLGFIIIMIIATAGFWVFGFVLSLLPYWIIGHWRNRIKKNKAEKEEKELA